MKIALQIAAALVVNGALFLLVAKTNATAKARPVKDAWTVREVFVAAPPPRSAPPVEELTSALPAESAAPAPPAPVNLSDSPAPEAFLPRLDAVPMDLGGSALGSGPPVPLGIAGGGSLLGAPGGVPGGTGGAGTGGALQLSQVDRGP
ncbi:MAG TPA: hypothetical protein VM029_05535, partial [Opitutaceae bacterium]|nr:hypothetical protein [Opitutaceae bacterium]